MPLQFHKMHGAGNDFVLLDFRQSGEDLEPDMARRLADRRLGVGCDQVLVLKSSELDECTARYLIFNADGSPAGQCGNGVRCIALYLQARGELDQADPPADPDPMAFLQLEGPAGVIRVRACPDGEFECAMGAARFEPDEVPIDTGALKRGNESQGGANRYTLDIDGQELTVGAVSMGNPHAVTVVDDAETAPVEKLGPLIVRHRAFPEGCNAGFVQIVDRETVRLRVFERGTGETLACGSGACAAVAVLASEGRVSDTVNVLLPGGHLVIKWGGPGNEMTMKGPAAHIFRGTLDE